MTVLAKSLCLVRIAAGGKPGAGLLKSPRNGGVLGLALALAILFGSRQEVFAATRTIVLNTGYDQWLASPAPIPVGGLDNEWRVIVDPTNPPGNSVSTGRPADVVMDGSWTFNASLGTNYPNSVWSSVNPNRDPGSQNPPTSFQYAYYFTLPPGFSSPQLTMHLSADDHITRVTLNSCTLFTGLGGIFNGNTPLMLPDPGNPHFPSNPLSPSCFGSGKDVNVLTVTVRDTAGVLTGLIVDGTVTYEECERPPIRTIPNLTSITFWEGTFAAPVATTLAKNGSKLTGRLTTLGLGSSDFEGVPDREFYDVFYSGWDGTPDPDGAFVTIEALYQFGQPSGGGLNIGRVDLVGTGLFADSVASFVALGDNALPSLVGNAVDNDTVTFTTMGNTMGTPQRLRLTVGFPCPCVHRPPGAVAWWALDEPNSNNEYGDLAGGDNNGMIVGSPSSIAGQYVGNSIQVGIGDYVQVSNSSNLNFGRGSFSMDAWVRFTPGTQTEPIVYKLATPSGSGGGYFLYIAKANPQGTQFRLQLQIATSMYPGPIISAPQGTWVFVAAAVNSATVNLHVGVPSGTLVSSTNARGVATASSTAPLWIGAWQGNPHAGLGIDEVEIFNRALTLSEAMGIFRAGSSGKCKPRSCTGAPGLAFLDFSTGLTAIGNADPIWRVATAPSGVPTPLTAYAIAPSSPIWAPAPLGPAGTQTNWIDPNNSGGLPAASDPLGLYVYETDFLVPSGTSNVSVALQFAADNDIVMSLLDPAGTPIASLPVSAAFNSLTAFSVPLSGPTAGIYRLKADVSNTMSTTGLLVEGKVRCTAPLAKVCVFKFDDRDGDGVRDANEGLLPDWTFNVNPGPPNQVTTGPQGGICFDVATQGLITITEQVKAGWVPTTPPSQSVSVAPGQVANVVFGNRNTKVGLETTRLSGEIWNFQGIAQGGTVSAAISGCSVSISTGPGQSAQDVAEAFAAAINEDACLQAQDIRAQAAGTTVSVIGLDVAVGETAITDPGIQHEAIPTLPVQDFATAVGGSGNITEVVFVQGAGTTQTAALGVFRSQSGEPLDMQSILLSPNSTSSAFFEGDAELEVGHLQTLVSPGVVASQIIHLAIPGFGDVPPIGLPPSPVCGSPVIALKRNLEFDTGAALSNTTGEEVSCDWSIYSGSQGNLAGTGTTLVPPLGQTQFFPLNDPSLPPLDLPFEGNIQFRCDIPVHAFSLFQRTIDGAIFSNAAGCLDPGGGN